MATSKRNYLFVYGTLRRDADHEMSRLLARYADFVGEGTFRGKLYDAGEYPGAVPTNRATDVVRGEVYALRNPDRVLPVLDEYEGCGPDDPVPTEFRRERVTIALETGGEVSAWAYLYNWPTDDLKPLVSGDYFQLHARLNGGGQHRPHS